MICHQVVFLALVICFNATGKRVNPPLERSRGKKTTPHEDRGVVTHLHCTTPPTTALLRGKQLKKEREGAQRGRAPPRMSTISPRLFTRLLPRSSRLVHVGGGVDGGRQRLDLHIKALLHLVEGLAVILQAQQRVTGHTASRHTCVPQRAAARDKREACRKWHRDSTAGGGRRTS